LFHYSEIFRFFAEPALRKKIDASLALSMTKREGFRMTIIFMAEANSSHHKE